MKEKVGVEREPSHNEPSQNFMKQSGKKED